MIEVKNQVKLTIGKMKAVVDWIELEITTAKRTNAQTVRRALLEILGGKNLYVDPKDLGQGSAASVFRFRIQDPERFRNVAEVLTKISERFPLATPPTVTAVEVALDLYGEGPDLVAHLFRSSAFLAHKENHRMYRDFKGSGIAIPRGHESLVRRLQDGYQIAVGNQDDDCYQHMYWKTTDNGQSLPVEHQRARTEIRLRGAALPFDAIDDWNDFNFGKIAKYFKFRKLRNDLSGLERVIANAKPQIGGKRDRRQAGRLRLHNPLTTDDSILSERARDALRKLSKRWKTNGRYRTGCEISGTSHPKKRNAGARTSGTSNNYISTNSISTSSASSALTAAQEVLPAGSEQHVEQTEIAPEGKDSHAVMRQTKDVEGTVCTSTS